jgi:hypothetical protein
MVFRILGWLKYRYREKSNNPALVIRPPVAGLIPTNVGLIGATVEIMVWRMQLETG